MASGIFSEPDKNEVTEPDVLNVTDVAPGRLKRFQPFIQHHRRAHVVFACDLHTLPADRKWFGTKSLGLARTPAGTWSSFRMAVGADHRGGLPRMRREDRSHIGPALSPRSSTAIRPERFAANLTRPPLMLLALCVGKR